MMRTDFLLMSHTPDQTTPQPRNAPARGGGILPASPIEVSALAGSHQIKSPFRPVVPRSIRVSVTLPVYNEIGLIDKTFQTVAAFAQEHGEYQFVFVSDGSTDGTGERLDALKNELVQQDPSVGDRFRVIRYAPNRGKGEAVRTGMLSSTAPYVLFTDGDLAYSLDHLPRLVSELEGGMDMVIGCRRLVDPAERNTTVPRRVMGWTFNKCAKLILGLRHPDTQAGLKGFRQKALRDVFAMQKLGNAPGKAGSGFAFDIELMYIAKKLRLKVMQVAAFVDPEHSYKRSKVNLFRDPLRMFGALVRVRMLALRGRYKR